MKKIIAISVFLLIFCSGISGNPVLILMGHRLANAQTWTALPPYNFLWPLWDPVLSPVNPLTGLPTPIVTDLSSSTELPVQRGLAWNPAIGYPYFLYNSPDTTLGMLYYDFNDIPYKLNPWPPTYALDPLIGTPLPISLPLGFSLLPATDQNLIQEILSVDPNLVLHEAGFIIKPTSGLVTTEAPKFGYLPTFTVRLTFPPIVFNAEQLEGGYVKIKLYSSNPEEGIADPNRLFFDASNWNVDQIINAKGMDDYIADGNQNYTIILYPDSTNDPSYQDLDPDDVSVVNVDNDFAGFVVEPTIGLETSEDGERAVFEVRLTSQPARSARIPTQIGIVRILVWVKDIVPYRDEGILISPSQQYLNTLTFTEETWNINQTVIVEGKDDTYPDGNQIYYVNLKVIHSTDTGYSGLIQEVAINNLDNETVPHKDPIAILTGHETLDEGQQGNYDASYSFPYASIIKYEWDWEYDGVNFNPNNIDTGSIQTHIWEDDGDYIVAVKITDFKENTDIGILDVEVKDRAPAPEFTWQPEFPEEGYVVNFMDASTSYPDAIIGWYWDFYEQEVSSARNPVFEFDKDGNYLVTLTLTDDDGSVNAVSHNVIITDRDPVADFNKISSTEGYPLTLKFTDASASYDGITRYFWDFGDSNTADFGDSNIAIGKTVTHSYATPGTYDVSLTVEEADGDKDTKTKAYNIEVVNSPPTAEANGPYTGTEGQSISFNSTGSGDVNGDSITYNWDFGDGATSTIANPSHTYAQNGIYTVTLSVSDGLLTDMDTATINIEDTEPNADFSGVPTTGIVPLMVNLTDASSSYDGIIRYSWNFGDGNTTDFVDDDAAIGKAVTHSYATSGTYDVSLTVEEADGDKDTMTKLGYITIRCTNNDECPTGAYCKKVNGDCEGGGECIDRPDICSEILNLVCGCDGKTYTNVCKAAINGINIDYAGECSRLARSAWPCKGYDSKRTGHSTYVGAQTSTLAWSYPIGAPIKSSPAIDANGTVYVGSDDGKVYALESGIADPNHRVKWSYETEVGIGSSPAIDANGRIYVGSDDGKFYVLNPDGSLHWNYQTEGKSNYSSPGIGADGTIYVGSNDGRVYAFNPDGSLNWSYQTMSATLNSSPAIGTDGTLYIGGSNDGKIYALDPNGSLKWSYETGAVTFASPAIGADGIIYIGCSLGKLHALDPEALDPNARVKWTYQTGFEIGSAPAIGADGTIYIGSGDGKIYALNNDGSLKWSYQTEDRILWSSPAIGADETIYIGSFDGSIYALNNKGGLKWSYQTGEKYIYSSPAIGVDGTVYIGGNDGILYAFNIELEVEPTRGLETTEDGNTDIFEVWLTGKPEATVSIDLKSSDETEGMVSPLVLTFTEDNWNIPKAVTVTGLDDDIPEGSQVYTIFLRPAMSGEVSVINKDNDLMHVSLWIEPDKMKMISFVHRPDNPNAISVFGDKVRENYGNKKLFKIGTYKPELSNYIEYGENMTVEPGKAYWYYARNGINISFYGILLNPVENMEVELSYDSNNKDGWNMIACPYNLDYNWDNVQVMEKNQNGEPIYGPKRINILVNDIDPNYTNNPDPGNHHYIYRFLLWKWRNGTYVYYDPDPNSDYESVKYEKDPDPYMRPNEGYWVKVLKKNVYLKFPPLNRGKIKRSNYEEVITRKKHGKGKTLTVSRKAITSDNSSPPAPPGSFESNEGHFSETKGGGCFINNISFGLPKHTL